MIIDNTNLIRSLLVFPEIDYEKTLDNRDCFYSVQLLQRQKDNPDLQFMNPNFRNNSNRSIQQFQIYSLEDWDLKISTIIKLARVYQCRVYIDLNIKDSRDVFANMFSNMSARFSTNNYSKLHRMYNQAIGETSTMKGQRNTWVIDIDTHDEMTINNVKKVVESLPGGGWSGRKVNIKLDDSIFQTNGAEILAEIPTKNGVHLITSTFDLNVFRRRFPDIDVHKNNPTIVWMETDWSDSKWKL